MERSSWAPRTFLLALVLGATLRARAAVGYYPRFSPFFFLCTHHGELEGDGEQGEVLISLHIAGHPTYYVPGQEYHGQPSGARLCGPAGDRLTRPGPQPPRRSPARRKLPAASRPGVLLGSFVVNGPPDRERLLPALYSKVALKMSGNERSL
ncbi:hypothetical protein E5288_WYG003489 [Bos mutus]|uniref:Reelin n=1 Tax=Bos mutus TaxID=72004 RepID=A0A6B0SB51_9CETA|nr:hypothetical protein [Bos mutus]